MQALLSPGSLVTIAGAVLTVIGTIAYATDIPNLSLPTIFYGIPILLGGLALKSSELPPPKRLTPAPRFKQLRDLPESEPLRKLLADVDRWRYGQKAHLESSLEVLKLWDEESVLLLPSKCFYQTGFVRVVTCISIESADEFLRRFNAFIDRYIIKQE